MVLIPQGPLFVNLYLFWVLLSVSAIFMKRWYGLKELTNLLDVADKDIKKEDADKQVEIEHCINIKTLSDFKVSCSYRDIVFVICILKEYLKLIEEREGFTWEYYREQFSKLANRLSEQIEYDYDVQMEKCLKKMGKKERNDDVGEDAMALAVKRGKK